MRTTPKKRTYLKIVLAVLCVILLTASYYQFLYKPKEVNSGIFILYKTLNGHTSDVWAAKFSADGKRFASGSVDSTVRIYNSKGDLLKIIKQPQGITNLQFSPDGKYIATSSYDGKLRLWTKDGDFRREFNYSTTTLWTIDFSADGKIIAGAGEEGIIKLWMVTTGELIATLTGHQANIWCIKFSNDGTKLSAAVLIKRLKYGMYALMPCLKH
jgi:WD40 repeat protein